MVKTFFNGSSLNAVAAADDDDGLGDHGGREEKGREGSAGRARTLCTKSALSVISVASGGRRIVCGRQ